MSLVMSVALSLAAAGGALTLATDSGAPVSEQLASWNLAFVGGLGAVVLGGSGAVFSALAG